MGEQEARILQIFDNAAIERINHQGILYMFLLFSYWRFCVLYTDTVSIKSSYGYAWCPTVELWWTVS